MSLLANYYAGMNEENAAKAADAYSQMRLTDQQAQQVAPNAESQRTLQGAQAGATAAQGAKSAAEAQQVAPTAAADQRLSNSRATQLDQQTQQQPLLDASTRLLQGAQAANLGATTRSTLSDLPGANAGAFGMPVIGSALDPTKPQGYAQGGTVQKGRPADAVPGKGKPAPADTVAVKLAPGEGVLNKGAMEHYGSDVLDHMNKMGLMRMGAQSEVAKAAGMKDPHAAPAAAKGGKSDAGGGKGKAAAKSPPPLVAHGKGPAQSLFTTAHLQRMGVS